MRFEQIPTPSYVIDEAKLKSNLEVLADVQKKAGCRILLAQKAFSSFVAYPLIGSYLAGATASGLYEARLGAREMGKENHVFAPAYTREEIRELNSLCDHIILNSLTQLEEHYVNLTAEIGLRINPECSTQEHGIYDPCGPYSRLGVRRETLERFLEEKCGKHLSVPEAFAGVYPRVSGLHFHTLCEQNADALQRTLAAVEERFGDLLAMDQIKWLNMGGGHHITREDYDRDLLISEIKRMKETYRVEVYLEPGEAVALNAGYLVTRVMDIVENGRPILIMDASAACHMPDVLEMPYTPPLRGARIAEGNDPGDDKIKDNGNDEKAAEGVLCRVSSRTCLAGDITGDYYFPATPKVGDRLVFEDMAIYSIVKNNTFNGMPLPDIWYLREDGEAKLVKRFSYEDFKERLS